VEHGGSMRFIIRNVRAAHEPQSYDEFEDFRASVVDALEHSEFFDKKVVAAERRSPAPLIQLLATLCVS